MTLPDHPIVPDHPLLNPRTLRFEDPDLELEYRSATIDQVRRETFALLPISFGLWLVAGLLLPVFTAIPVTTSTPIVLFMAAVLILATVELKGKSEPIAAYELLGLVLEPAVVSPTLRA